MEYNGKDVFVFGSNLAGRHGAGAAKFAVDNCGAVYGQGIGMQGNSYGIPTKDMFIQTLPLSIIAEYVKDFKEFAEENPNLTFYVTKIGCGLAGYTPKDIGPMFMNSPTNCILPVEFKNEGG